MRSDSRATSMCLWMPLWRRCHWRSLWDPWACRWAWALWLWILFPLAVAITYERSYYLQMSVNLSNAMLLWQRWLLMAQLEGSLSAQKGMGFGDKDIDDVRRSVKLRKISIFPFVLCILLHVTFFLTEWLLRVYKFILVMNSFRTSTKTRKIILYASSICLLSWIHNNNNNISETKQKLIKIIMTCFVLI